MASNASHARGLFILTLVVGLVLPTVVGLVVRARLQSQGVDVVSLGEGARYMVPLTLWAAVPFVVLALILRAFLRRRVADQSGTFRAALFAAAGSLAGVAVVQGVSLFRLLGYTGPGGMAEAVSMTLFLWMLTIPWALVLSAVGAAIGAAAGGLAHLAWSRFRARTSV